MLRFVAPAGAPVHITQILRALSATISGPTVEKSSLTAILQSRHVVEVSSGRAALTITLQALHRLRPDRDAVALPAYTCYTVAGAIARAGLKIHPVEIDPDTLDFDPQQLSELPQGRILCILSSNLFGLMNNSELIRSAANAHEAFVVDDAAQALGARSSDKCAGFNGDAGFYSFGRGKALAAIEGGIIVTNSDAIATALEGELKSLEAPGTIHSLNLLVQLLAYSLLLRPSLFWLPNSMPFLKFGVTEFDTRFHLGHMPGLVKNLLVGLMPGLEALNKIRRQNAEAFFAAIQGNTRFVAPRAHQGVMPNYIRFPVLAATPDLRDQAVKSLRAQGIGATTFYPAAICDIVGIERHLANPGCYCLNAESVAQRLFTLPTHPYLRQKDISVIRQTLERIAQ